MIPSSPVKACVFDAYGTLFDIHSATAALAADLGEKASAISAQWRAKQLEYTWLRSLMGHYADFRQITADALDYALEANGISDGAIRDRLLSLYDSPKAYPDAMACLEKLKSVGMRTGILSNGSPAMLSTAIFSAALGPLLDYVLSVDTIQIYKPSPRVYHLAVDAFGVTAGEIAFVSSNAWDCAGAAAFGFNVIHVDRTGAPEERLGFPPRKRVSDLSEAAAFILNLPS